MNSSYNKEQAARALEQVALERQASTYGLLHAARITEHASWMSQYVVAPSGAAWVMATVGSPQDGNEEFVTSFQGIICKMDLPPFTEKIGATSPHVKHLRQSLTLTGLDTATFQNVSENIIAIYHLFQRLLAKDSIQDLTAIGQVEGSLSIDMSNRYFTPRRDGLSATEIPFSTDIDPHGFLTKAAGTSLFHSEDNEVYYYERVSDANRGDHRFIPTKPITFRHGDIVEVQVSFAMLPLREKKFKLSLILRSRAHLNNFLQATASKKPLTLKRRVGYAEEELGATRAKLGRMDIDQLDEVSAQSASNLD